jgi:type 1 fimbria pilin
MGDAAAACDWDPNWERIKYSINLGDITVPQDAKVGSVLKTVDAFTISGGDGTTVPVTNFDCGGTYATHELRGTASNTLDKVYSTGLAGLGYRIVWPNGQYVDGSTVGPLEEGRWTHLVGTSKFQLIKTGEMTAGKIPTGQYFLSSITSLGPAYSLAVSYGSIKLAGCTTKSTVTKDLGRISAKTLSENGTAGRNSFSLGLTCSGSFVGKTKITATKPSGNSTVGLIQNTGDASGVAVRLLDKDGTVTFDTWKSYGNQDDKWDPSYFAELYKIGDVKSGSVRATATATLSYE